MDDRTVRGSRLTVTAVAVTIMIAGCGSRPAKAPAAVQARGGGAPPLLATVPADAGIVIHIAPGLVETLPAVAAEQFRASLADDPDPPGSLDAAFTAELLAQPSLAQAVGWRPGKSEVVAWAKGKTLVVRARVDGAAIRGLLDRAERRSGKPIARTTLDGRSYLTWTADDGARGYARIDDDEVIALMSDSGERALSLLTEAPVRAFDPRPLVDALFPGRADAHFGAMIDPSWLMDVAGDEVLAQLPNQACVGAIAEVVAELPSLNYAWARSATATEIAAAVKLPPDTAATLARGVAPIPRWLVDERYATMGFGISVPSAVEVVQPWAARFDQLASRCGESAGAVTGLAMLSSLPPVTQIERGSMVMDLRSETFALAIKPVDLARFWAALTALAPLRPLPPAAGERLTVPGARLSSDGSSLLVATPSALGDDLLANLASAPAGPTALFAMVLGKGSLAASLADDPDDDARQFLQWVSGMAFEVGVERGHLVTRAAFRHR